MDSALLDMMRSGGRNKAWAETMVNLEARKLVDTANRLSAKVEFVRENNKIVGYVISAVNVVLSGAEIALGTTLLASANPLGVRLEQYSLWMDSMA
ncbi:MAG: hypothetical protein H6R25_348 [Proteobacteria bacterium]|nr:hypothetical protein [Pseudomonadota bacterium]